jgi:hypothetical protein
MENGEFVKPVLQYGHLKKFAATGLYAAANDVRSKSFSKAHTCVITTV